MDAQLEKRKRVIFFAVLAFLGFVSLGVFMFPHAAHAQCVWDCDLGSDPFFNPWGNSPQSQLDIAYCVDPSCVIRNLTPIIGPIPTGSTDVGLVPKQPPSSTCTNGGNADVTISGPVVAWLRDTAGNVVPGSPAQAQLSITIKCAKLNGTAGSGSSTITRVVVAKEPQTNVFAADSQIKILALSATPSLNRPKGWTGCPANNQGLTGDCAFPLGIVQFNNDNAIKNALPQAGFFATGEVFHAEESNRFVGIRDCKGNANGQPSTIACSSGEILTGGNSLALLPLTGNWSGANNHTFNPKSGSNPFDITTTDPTDPSGPPVSIDPGTVVASANGGSPVFPTGCNDIPSQNVERCFFIARDFNISCKTGQHVTILVTGQLEDGRKFESTDDTLTCSNK